MTLRKSALALRPKKGRSTIYLLRHAHSQANGRGILAGQKPGIKLSAQGRKQAKDLIGILETLKIEDVQLSPLERCRETIAPFIERHLDLPVSVNPSFIEMHYGEWSGEKLALLSRKSLWRTIQKSPSAVRFPAGESFLEMSSRAIEGIESLRNDNKVHLVVSHGDVIRVILNHYLGSHLDTFQRLAIDPGSISSLVFNGEHVSIQRINSTASFGAHEGSTLGGGAGKK
ncbi:MAG: histidine phosphatase family protein [Actinomycetes bacterium]|jgi:probable phosphoglycerate mutase